MAMKTKISRSDGKSLMKRRNWGEKYEDYWRIVEVTERRRSAVNFQQL